MTWETDGFQTLEKTARSTTFVIGSFQAGQPAEESPGGRFVTT